MEAEFWHERWREDKHGFDQAAPNPLLVAHFDALALKPGERVFVPLCGKTVDIPWLQEQGLHVVGAELSETAVEQLFEIMGVTPEIVDLGNLKRYSGDGIDIFAGDIFDLSAGVLGDVDAVFDRAALVALPEEMRARYSAHLSEITGNAPQLLITFDYDQSIMPGPPFSVPEEMVRRYYGATFTITRLGGVEVAGNLKGIAPATEEIWLLATGS